MVAKSPYLYRCGVTVGDLFGLNTSAVGTVSLATVSTVRTTVVTHPSPPPSPPASRSVFTEYYLDPPTPVAALLFRQSFASVPSARCSQLDARQWHSSDQKYRRIIRTMHRSPGSTRSVSADERKHEFRCPNLPYTDPFPPGLLYRPRNMKPELIDNPWGSMHTEVVLLHMWYGPETPCLTSMYLNVGKEGNVSTPSLSIILPILVQITATLRLR